ncbi:MAG TPA: hypothetical protein VLI68_00815 [Hanamia sp.]|jgi:hypothetical protein|nr:hypothetical protein [Hanamia sp.]
MKFFKVCLIFFIVAGFSACEVQGTVDDTVDGTPTKSDTVLPAKFVKYQKADSVKETHESLPKVLRR